MFEHLSNDPSFKRLSNVDKQNYFDTFLQNDTGYQALMSNNENEQSKAAAESYRAGLEKSFWSAAGRSILEEVRDAAYDLAMTPAKVLAGGSKFLWEGVGAIAGDTALGRQAKAQVDYLETKINDWTYHPEMARYHDAAVRGVTMGWGLGAGVYKLQAYAAPWVKNLTNIVSKTSSAKMTAASAGVGETAIELTMDKLVEPVLDQTELSPEARMAASAALYLFLGFTSAMTLERKLDKLMGNKIFLDWVQEAGAKAKNALARAAGSDTPMREMDIVQHAIFNDPELLRRLYKELGEPDDGIENILRAGHEIAGQFGDRMPFGGPQLADPHTLRGLDRAKVLQSSGATPDDVWQKTGWFEVVPGQWRYEVNADDLKFKPGGIKNLRQAQSGVMLDELIDSPKLFEEFPFLRELTVRHDPSWPPGSGRYVDEDGLLELSIPLGTDRAGRRIVDMLEAKRVFLHEMQHDVQYQGGMSRGGSPESGILPRATALELKSLERKMAALEKRYPDLQKLVPDAPESTAPNIVKARYAQLAEEHSEILTQALKDGEHFKGYEQLLGEAESRLTFERHQMTPAQRRAESPRVTMEKMLKREGYLADDMTLEDVLIVRDPVTNMPQYSKNKQQFILDNAKKQREAMVKAGKDTTGIDKYIAQKEAELGGKKPAEPKAKPATAQAPAKPTSAAATPEPVAVSEAKLGNSVFKTLELTDPVTGQQLRVQADMGKVKQALQEKLSIIDRGVVRDGGLQARYPRAAEYLRNRLGKEPKLSAFDQAVLDRAKRLREELVAKGQDTTGVDKRIARDTELVYDEQALVNGMRMAYNRFQPGDSWTAKDVDDHLNVLRELEEISSLFRAKRAEQFKTPWEWQKGLEGRVTPDQMDALTGIMQRLSRDPDFSVEWTKDQNAYAALAKIMKISDPKFFSHELGHWTWYQVLKPTDRMGFVERLWKNYYTPEDWAQLDPTRQFFTNMKGRKWINSRAFKMELVDEKVELDRPTELFANLVQDYIMTYRMPEAGFKAIIGKASKAFKRLANGWRNHENIPQELRQFVQKVMRAPDPRDHNPLHLREMEDLVARSYLFRPREELLKIIEGFDPSTPAAKQVDNWMQSIMLDGMSAFDALAKSQANMENIIERLHRDVLTWYHLDTGNPVEIDLAVRRLNELFMPANRAGVEKRIGAQYGKIAERDTGNIHIQTGGEKYADELVDDRYAAAKDRQQRIEDTQHSVRQQYQALKQMANDLGVMHQWMNKVKDGTDKQWIYDSRNQQALRVWRQAVDQDAMIKGERAVDDFAVTDAVKDPDTGEIRLSRGQASFDDESPFNGMGPAANRFVQLRLWPQAISAMMGLDTDSEHGLLIPGTNTRLTWNPQKWLTYGYGIGPALSAYSLFGRGVRQYGNRRLHRFWQNLENIDPGTAEYIANKWKGVSKHWLVRAFRQRQGLTGELATIDRAKIVDETKIQREFNEFAQRINDRFTKDEQRAIAEIIERTGDMSTAGWRQEVYDTAAEIQTMLRNIREELISAGYPRAMLEKHGDYYLHRVFKRKARERMSQDFETKLARKMYEGLDAGFLKPRGHAESLRAGQREYGDLWNLASREGFEIQAGDRVYDFGMGDLRQFVPDKAQRELRRLEVDEGLEWNHVWEVEKVQGNKLVLRRDHTKLERDAFGEIKEIAPRVAEYGKLVAKALAQARAINSISQLDELVFDPSKLRNLTPEPGRTVEEMSHEMLGRLKARGWVQVPDTELAPGLKRFGALSGKYVEPEVMYALKAATSTLPENARLRNAFRKWRSAMTVWKVAKTAYNPGTHGRNFTANCMMCVLDGRNPMSVLWEGTKHIARKDDLFRRAINAGMLDSNVLRGELGIDTFLTALERAEVGSHPLAGMDNAVLSWMNGFSAAMKRGALKVGKAPMRIYELGDEVFKMGIFAQEVARGADDAAAMAKAQELFFDYRDVPIGVRYMRDYGIVPFITYTYKVLPVLAKTMKENPHRLLGVIAAAELFSNIMLQSEFGDDFKDVKDWQQELFPDWMGKRPFAVGPKGSIYMGERKSDKGMDYSLWYDYIANLPGGDALTSHGLLGGFPFGMNPLVSIAYGMITNRDPNFEKAIAADEPLTTIQKVDNFNARMKFILRTLLPNVPLYPGSFSLEKLGQAATAQGIVPEDVANRMGWTGRDYWGTEESLSSEAVNFFGLGRIRKFYPEMETIRRFEKHEYAISKFEQQLNATIADGRTSQMELAKMVNKFKTVVKGNAEAMMHISDLYAKARKALAQRKKALRASQADQEPDR